jgi:hypothetical protein
MKVSKLAFILPQVLLVVLWPPIVVVVFARAQDKSVSESSDEKHVTFSKSKVKRMFLGERHRRNDDLRPLRFTI